MNDSMDGLDVPEMPPEQKARIDRKVRAAIAAQERRFAWERRGKWALSVSAAIAAACCTGALVFAQREVAPPESRSRIEAVESPIAVEPQAAPLPSVSGAEPEDPATDGAAPRRHHGHRHRRR
jgi:anti-sigma-K factor RskA